MVRSLIPLITVTILAGPLLASEVRTITSEEKVIAGSLIQRTELQQWRDFKYPLIITHEQFQIQADGSRKSVAREEMVGDHVLVEVGPGLDARAVERLAAEQGCTVRSKVFGSQSMYLLAFQAADHQALGLRQAALAKDGRVLQQSPDFIRHIDKTPDDANYGQLWGMPKIQAPQAWDITTGSEEIVVGVIDTGIDYKHPDLIDNMWRNPGETGTDVNGKDKATNGLDDDGNGLVDDVYGANCITKTGDPMDDHNHGSHCAGTIGGRGNNGLGVAGVCWRVRLVGLKFLSAEGSGYDSDAIGCLNYAIDKRLTLTSNSWGGGGYNGLLASRIATAGLEANQLFIAAAGNSGKDNDQVENYPSNYPADNLIAVAATDSTDLKAGFSNWGLTKVDLAAPGVGIVSTVRGSSYASYNGTSMATPHVAGAAALLFSLNPDLSYTEIRDAILSQVDPISAMTGRCTTGGRLNVWKAMQRLAAVNLQLESSQLAEVPTACNQDGTFNPGETLRLTGTVRNTSRILASQEVEAQIMQGDIEWSAPVTISEPISAGQAVSISLDFTVPPSAAAGGLTLDLVLRSGETASWTIPVPITISWLAVNPSPKLRVQVPAGTTTTQTIQVINGSYSTLAWSAGLKALGAYEALSSINDPSGPAYVAYVWNDISTTGTLLPIANRQNWLSAAIPIGFRYSFFGTDQQWIRLCSNGYLSFTDLAVTWNHLPLPSTQAPRNLIAWLWDHLYVTDLTQAWYQSDPTNQVFTVQINGIEHINEDLAGETASVQIRLSPERVTIYYRQVDFASAITPVIGIQDAAGAEGLTWDHQVSSELAVEFRKSGRPEWMTLAGGSSSSGTLPGKTSATERVASNLALGLSAVGRRAGDLLAGVVTVRSGSQTISLLVEMEVTGGSGGPQRVVDLFLRGSNVKPRLLAPVVADPTPFSGGWRFPPQSRPLLQEIGFPLILSADG